MLMNNRLIPMSILIIILFILFDGLSIMALGKLVETNSLKEALNFKLTNFKIKELGLKKLYNVLSRIRNSIIHIHDNIRFYRFNAIYRILCSRIPYNSLLFHV